MSGCGHGLTDGLRDLDEMGIDLQVVMPAPCNATTVPIDISVKATQIVNDGIAEYVARKPDRFVALGSVPMTDSLEAVTELERGTRHLGLKGAQVLTNVAGRELSDPVFAPFWAKAEELGALVVIHPIGVVCSIPCNLPYGLRHHVIFGPAQAVRLA
jgi:aminocarboxymuconate-semialdehyde decarboxylase